MYVIYMYELHASHPLTLYTDTQGAKEKRRCADHVVGLPGMKCAVRTYRDFMSKLPPTIRLCGPWETTG